MNHVGFFNDGIHPDRLISGANADLSMYRFEPIQHNVMVDQSQFSVAGYSASNYMTFNDVVHLNPKDCQSYGVVLRDKSHMINNW